MKTGRGDRTRYKEIREITLKKPSTYYNTNSKDLFEEPYCTRAEAQNIYAID